MGLTYKGKSMASHTRGRRRICIRAVLGGFEETVFDAFEVRIDDHVRRVWTMTFLGFVMV